MKSPNPSTSSVETNLLSEVAAYESEIGDFTPEQLRALTLLNATVRRTMDPLKLTLLFELLLSNMGYQAEISVRSSSEGDSGDRGALDPPENGYRFHFVPSEEVAGDDFRGWMDLVPIYPDRAVSQRDRLFLEYFCRQVGSVLEHQWLYQNLSRTQEKLLSALSTVQEISAFVGHEIRSPVASLLSLAFLLDEQMREMRSQRPLSSVDWKPLVDKISQVTALLRKVSRSTYLLGTLEIDPDTVRKDLEQVELGKSLLASASNTFFFDIRRRDLKVIIRRESRFVHDFIYVHRAWFEAIFDNLLGNAVKYSSEGGRIDFSILHRDGDYIIHVSNPVDRPPSAERLNRLFEKGYRGADSKFNIQQIGANQGLGLYFVHRIVQLGYGGRVRVWLGEDWNRDGAGEGEVVETQVFGDPDSPAPKEPKEFFHIEIRISESALHGFI